MGNYKRPLKKKLIEVLLPDTEWKRFYWIDDRTLFVDMRGIRKSRLNTKETYWSTQHMLKWSNVEHLNSLVEEYFKSCEGILFDRYGSPLTDAKGKYIMGQIKPYTVTGLALHLDLSAQQLKEYAKGNLDDIGYNHETRQFSDVLRAAYMKIEAFAEGKLYDRDAQRGAQYILDAKFGWGTQREQAEIIDKLVAANIKVEEHDLKKKQAESGELDDQVTFVIKRAGNG